MRRVLDFNPITKESVYFEYDHATDNIVITHEQDTSEFIDHNKRLLAKNDWKKKVRKDEMVKYASVPNIVCLKWKQELGVDIFDKDHRKKVFALLNSPEYSYLKTTDMHDEG